LSPVYMPVVSILMPPMWPAVAVIVPDILAPVAVTKPVEETEKVVRLWLWNWPPSTQDEEWRNIN
jgi:hypothetical protein